MVKFIQDAMADSSKSKRDIISVLVKTMGRYSPERSHEVVHASDVTKSDFCARQYILFDLLKIQRPDRYIAPGLRATFDVGNATADLVRNEWAAEHAIGNWECTSCKQVKAWQSKPKPGCAGMGNCNWRYEEVKFVHQPSGMSGSIDLIMALGMTKVTLIELKIMKVEDFDKLIAPLGEHKARTRLYLRIVAESDSPFKQWVDVEHAKILYVSRGFGKKNLDGGGQILPFKEFDVMRDDESVQPYIDRAQSVATARATGTIPIKTCESLNCSKAKACPVRADCFSGAYSG